MESIRLFTYQDVENAGKHTVIHADNEAHAQELIATGNAVKLDLPELDEFERKASGLHARYKKEVDAIKNNEDPRMTKEVKDWEIGKLDESYEAETAQLSQEYSEWRQAQQENAKKRASRAVVKVTKDDKQVADQFVTRASLRLATAIGSEKGVAAKQIIDDIAHLSDAEKTAMQSKIGDLLDELDAQDKHRLIASVQDVRNSDLLAEKVTSQLPVSILTEKRITDIAKKVVAESQFSHVDGGISREFYEEHLKVSDE